MISFPGNFRCLFAFVIGLTLAASRGEETSTVRASTTDGSLAAQMNSNSGDYQIRSQNPSWKFSGSLAAPLKNLKSAGGFEDLGDYRQISFDWQAGQVPMSGSIRIYNGKPVALFSQTCDDTSETPPAAFPAFTKLPKALHVFSYDNFNFAPPDFGASETSTPWLLFDNQDNAVIISPASHFMVASMMGNGTNEVASGFNSNLRNLPAGFTQQTLITFGHGINHTWDTWGHALLSLEHAQRPTDEADTVLKISRLLDRQWRLLLLQLRFNQRLCWNFAGIG